MLISGWATRGCWTLGSRCKAFNISSSLGTGTGAVTSGQNEVSRADLTADSRWQLVERVASSQAFQKSTRLRELLLHITERALHGHPQELTEQLIGHAVLGKSVDYAPVEDSSVRVHIRQLRLKLHEYFDCEGRAEPMVVEIPKGSYVPVFRTAQTPAAPPPAEPVAPTRPERRSLLGTAVPWALCGVLAVACVVVWFGSGRLERKNAAGPAALQPWPLSALFNGKFRTQIIVADSNYGMLRIISKKAGSLEEYLKPDLFNNFMPQRPGEHLGRITNYIGNSMLTSYADVAVVASLMNLVGGAPNGVMVRSARDLRLRDLDEGNYVFIGSPGSNPWVSLFESQLSFQEAEGVVGEDMKYFRNKEPRTGEQTSYQGLRFTGTAGEDYATIALLPNERHNGSILIFQGLQQEGTEAAGLFLTDANNRLRLAQALGVKSGQPKPVYFEVLLRISAVAGAPKATTIVATRLLK